MKLLDFPHDAYWVNRGVKTLYDDVPTESPITLTGSAPSVSFRVKVTISAVTDHEDCTGTVNINSETLTFTKAATKLSTTLLTVLPTVTYSGLDCNIAITCIDSMGVVINGETLTAFKMRFEATSKTYMDRLGNWTQSEAFAMTTSPVGLADIVRYGGIDYEVKKVESYPWLDGTELYRILYF